MEQNETNIPAHFNNFIKKNRKWAISSFGSIC